MSAALPIAAEHVMTTDDARRLTERIRLTALTVRDGMEKLQQYVDEAKSGRAWESLGYPSWTAYLADVLGDQPLRLERDRRRELVGYLSGEGMSTRAIAPIVGASDITVRRDLASGATNVAPAPALTDDPDRIVKLTGPGSVSAPQTPPGVEEPPVAPSPGPVQAIVEPSSDGPAVGSTLRPAATITGLDGKAYTRPEPAASRRRAITDAARDAGWDLRKATDRLQRVADVDRFARNKEEVATQLRDHLLHTVEVCQDLLDRLN